MSRKLLLALLGCCTLLGSVVTVGVVPAAAAGRPPVITMYSPTGDQGYFLGQQVSARYACSDPDGDATVVSCVGDLPWGTPLPQTPGVHTFTVTATDDQGNVTTKTVPYTFQAMTQTCTAAVIRLNDQIHGLADQGAPCTRRRSATYQEVVRKVPLLPLVGGTLGPTLTIEGGTAQAGSYSGETWAKASRVVIEAYPDEIELLGVETEAHAMVSPTEICGAAHTSASTIGMFRRVTLSLAPVVTELPALTVPLSIPLGVGTLHINQLVVEGNTIIRRGVYLDLPGTKQDVIVAESRAGITC